MSLADLKVGDTAYHCTSYRGRGLARPATITSVGEYLIFASPAGSPLAPDRYNREDGRARRDAFLSTVVPEGYRVIGDNQ